MNKNSVCWTPNPDCKNSTYCSASYFFPLWHTSFFLTNPEAGKWTLSTFRVSSFLSPRSFGLLCMQAINALNICGWRRMMTIKMLAQQDVYKTHTVQFLSFSLWTYFNKANILTLYLAFFLNVIFSLVIIWLACSCLHSNRILMWHGQACQSFSCFCHCVPTCYYYASKIVVVLVVRVLVVNSTLWIKDQLNIITGQNVLVSLPLIPNSSKVTLSPFEIFSHLHRLRWNEISETFFWSVWGSLWKELSL